MTTRKSSFFQTSRRLPVRQVLLRTLYLTLIALFINGLAFLFLGVKSFDKEVIYILNTLALIVAIPFVIGYIVADQATKVDHIFFDAAKVILFIVNGGLILLALFLCFVLFGNSWALLSPIPYIVSGIYIFYETARIIAAPKARKRVVQEDLLDDLDL